MSSQLHRVDSLSEHPCLAMFGRRATCVGDQVNEYVACSQHLNVSGGLVTDLREPVEHAPLRPNQCQKYRKIPVCLRLRFF